MEVRSSRQRFAQVRFAIIVGLLAQSPGRGELRPAIKRLAAQSWTHPVSGEPVCFAYSTIERWFYQARKGADPVGVLRARRRSDAGHTRQLSAPLAELLREQHRQYPHWTVQLHYDNLQAVLKARPSTASLPSYATVRRYFKRNGLERLRRRPKASPGEIAAAVHRASVETRSYEAQYCHGLWHADFHHGSRAVLTRDGWQKPVLLGILDDHSRLGCHAQWYLTETTETTETLTHGAIQAIAKHGLPRAWMTDNGAPFIAAEFAEGLDRLGILAERTLPYSPNQNGKQESFWARIENRLMAMLDDVEQLTLQMLNDTTWAWLEREYHRTEHGETGCTPLARARSGKSVARPSPDSDTLRAAFRRQVTRRQRKSDGTVSLDGQRFEVPSRFRHLDLISVHYARWDLGSVDMTDGDTQTHVGRLYPVDKQRNAEAERRRFVTPDAIPETTRSGRVAPLLEQYLAEYAATGLPPAYMPFDHEGDAQ